MGVEDLDGVGQHVQRIAAVHVQGDSGLQVGAWSVSMPRAARRRLTLAASSAGGSCFM